MNANQIINMVIRIVMNKVLHRGINAGINKVAGKGKPAEQMTPEERRQAQSAKQTGKRARQAMRVGRKFGKF